MDLAVYAVDVGSVPRKRLGWARAYLPSGHVDQAAKETEIGRLVNCVAADLVEGRPVALGFECPLYVPVPANAMELGKARGGEGNRSWSAGAGSGAMATGLVQAAWVLRALRAEADNVQAYFDWDEFAAAQHGLFLWEAFVTAAAKGPDHPDDAAAAVHAFCRAYPDPSKADPISAPTPLSLIAAAALWSGWIDDLDELHCPCLVVKAEDVLTETEPQSGQVRSRS
jgi:hypothetical protein